MAMPAEAAPVRAFFNAYCSKTQKLTANKITEWYVFETPIYFVNKFKVEKIILTICGIGTVNAAIGATQLVTYGADYLLNFGTAGLFAHKIALMQPIIISAAAYLQPDATPFGYAPGQIPGEPRQWFADLRYTNAIKNVFKQNKQTYISGSLLTSDAFLQTKPINNLHPFKKLITGDMEGAAIFHTAKTLKINVGAIKFGSDYIGKELNGASQHEQTLRDLYPEAIGNVLKILFKI